MVVRYGDGTPDDSEVHLGIEDALHSGFDYAYLYSTQENCWKCFERDRFSFKVMHEVSIPGNRRQHDY